jgi:hypothetical protein
VHFTVLSDKITSLFRNAYKILVGKPEGKRHLEDQRINENITVALGETVAGCGLDSSGSG